MSFLFPTILWGLFGASIPLIIHLVSIRRTQKVDFSTIRFIKSLKHDAIRNLKLRNWILLAVRTLTVILVVLAFARPVRVGYFPPWAAGQLTSKLVFLLDNSASMSARFEGESLLERSKKTLLRILKGVEGKISVDVYQTTPLQKRYSGDSSDIVDMERILSLIRETQGRDDLWQAVPAVLREAAGDKKLASGPANWEFYVFSDFPLPLPDGWSADRSEDQKRAPDWRYYLFPQPDIQNNLAVVSAEVSSHLRLPNLLVTILGKVENQGLKPQKDIPVQLYFEGERVGQVVGDFGPSNRKDFVFRAFPNRSGLVHGILEIPEDDYPLDDRKFFYFPIPSRIRCKLVGPSEGDLSFVTLALNSINDDKQFLSLEVLSTYAVGNLSLDDVDVLILVDPSHLKPGLVEEIQKFGRKGGGLILFLGGSYADWINSEVLDNLGLPGVNEVVRLSGGSFHQVVDIDTKHPLFEGFPVANLFNEMPQVFAHLRLSRAGSRNGLLTLSDGDPLLVERRDTGLRMLYFTTMPDLKWSDFPVRGIFVPLLHRMLVYLATLDDEGARVEVGSRIEVPLGPGLMSTDLRLVKPSGASVFLVPDYQNEVVVIDEVHEAGIYGLYSGDRFVSSFTANISPSENPNNRMDSRKLADIFSSERSRIIGHTEDALESVVQARRGTDLWPLFLAGAVAILMTETWVGRVRKDREQ